MVVFWIFCRFCYYGCLCLSGGGALTPIYIEDLVNKLQWLTLHEFGNISAISQMTPGPIGINVATFIGFQQAGVWGALAATVGLLFFPYFFMILAVKFLVKWEKSRLVVGIMSGIKPATVGLIFAALLIFLEMSVLSGPIPWHWFMEMFSSTFHTATYLRPVALVIFIISAVLMVKTRLSIMSVIFSSAIVGALLAKFLQ